jgi:hypothetical protein
MLDYGPDVLIRRRSRADTIRGAIAKNSRSGVEAAMVAAARVVLPRRALTKALLVAIAAVAFLVASAPPAVAAVYDPLNVISVENWRDVGSMSQADVQAFLEAQTGVLKSRSFIEHGTHGGSIKSASQIIWEAAQANNLNPKVILATLQKEQSLLTAKAPSTTTLNRAMGCGVYATSKDFHVGFGDQVWTGAQKLSEYEVTYHWFPDLAKEVYSYPDKHKIMIVCANAPTYSLYVYTPYYPQKSFWDIYVRYFGDPQAPPRLKPVYEFLAKRTGAYYYTSSPAERYHLVAKRSNVWTYRGAAFSVDASAPANTVPLWRLKNTRTGRYTLTASIAERDALLRQKVGRSKVYALQGAISNVSLTAETSATPVYRLYNKYRNTYYYTTSAAKCAALVGQRGIKKWKNNGVVFYLGPYAPDPTK